MFQGKQWKNTSQLELNFSIKFLIYITDLINVDSREGTMLPICYSEHNIRVLHSHSLQLTIPN